MNELTIHSTAHTSEINVRNKQMYKLILQTALNVK